MDWIKPEQEYTQVGLTRCNVHKLHHLCLCMYVSRWKKFIDIIQYVREDKRPGVMCINCIIDVFVCRHHQKQKMKTFILYLYYFPLTSLALLSNWCIPCMLSVYIPKNNDSNVFMHIPISSLKLFTMYYDVHVSRTLSCTIFVMAVVQIYMIILFPVDMISHCSICLFDLFLLWDIYGSYLRMGMTSYIPIDRICFVFRVRFFFSP